MCSKQLWWDRYNGNIASEKQSLCGPPGPHTDIGAGSASPGCRHSSKDLAQQMWMFWTVRRPAGAESALEENSTGKM